VAIEKAILIPANPNLEYVGGNEGSIIAHAVKIEEIGANFWWLVVPGNWEAGEFPHADIRAGYLYDVPEKRVTHSCRIKWIRPSSEVGFREANRYSIGEIKTGREYKRITQAQYAVKITNIFALKRTHRPEDFFKFSDGKPVQRVMNYCIVQDPHFAHHGKSVTRGEIMSSHMADLLLRGRVTEKDIEDLFFYRLMKSAEIVDRQGTFKKLGRLDLLVKDRLGDFVVYELKKGVAGMGALKQVKAYMKGCAKKYRTRKVSGVILAQDAEPELDVALKKEPRVEFKKYWFRVEMQ
jgi:hypothetical protein